MILYVSHPFFEYEAGNLCRLFFPYESLTVVHGEEEITPDSLLAKAVVSGNTYTASISGGGRTATRTEKVPEEVVSEYSITKALFQAFREFSGYDPKWGMLTGIHPVKFFISFVHESNLEDARRIFAEKYFVSAEKIQLCCRIAKAQNPVISAITPKDFGLYISIPFCPSRCAYCSFVSQSIEKAQKLIEPYFSLLLEELGETAAIAGKAGLRLVSVYIGGGTPTTLNAAQLTTLIKTVQHEFDMTSCKEFTVEAGRPDTIDQEKLAAFRTCGVTRISINPQSLEDRVLQNIGRKHTAADVVNTYALARAEGIDNINMDLIAGLEGDTPETFMATVEKVLAMAPENITVHSLSLKRSAEIFRQEGKELYHNNKEAVEKMIAYSVLRLTEEGYEPYYLYRQSRMAGNLENTGWAKKGTVCAYNIYTMDESLTVMACGAGGVTKIKDPYSDQLERIFNFKYAYEYISRFPEIKSRKKEVIHLYEQFCQRLREVHQSSGTN